MLYGAKWVLLRPPNVLYLLSDDHSDPDENGQHRVLLEPYGYRWYRMGGLDYLLKRTET